jgi:LPXTG-motif cell wall-anchored protein
MVDCPLPRTGSSTLVLVLLALGLLGGGILLLRIIRRRGVGGGVAVVVVLAVGAVLAVSDGGRADAAACPSSTTVAPPTTAGVTTTTSATTATSPVTTTTVAVPDLTPNIQGPTTAMLDATYTVEISNVGNAPTTGQMTFTVSLAATPADASVESFNLVSADWTINPVAGGFSFTSNSGFVLAPGAVTTATFSLFMSGGQVMLATTLPTGIGGETNAANNTASHTTVFTGPPTTTGPNG